MKKALVIPADELEAVRVITFIEGDDGDELNLMQSAVGGYIQIVPCDYSPALSLFVDEEGKLKGSPVNVRATKFCTRTFQGQDVICGDALIMGNVDSAGETLGLSDEWLQQLRGIA